MKKNVLKRIRKPKIAIFLSFLILLISCNNSEELISLKSGDLTFKIGETKTIWDKGDNYLTHYSANGEELILNFDSKSFEGITTVEHIKTEGYNLKINFQGLEKSIFFKNIKQQSNNSVTFDIVFSTEPTAYSSSVALENNFTVDQFVSSIVGEHNLGREINEANISKCPVCIIIIGLAVIAACENAQNACSPCNGNLSVGPCYCNCDVIKP